jgi:hypothetical protein
MDPISLIVAALAAGAIAGAQTTAAGAVGDAYSALRRLVGKRMTQRPGGELVVERHSERPDEWRGALESELAVAGADRDSELVNAARRFMELLQSADPGSATYSYGDFRGAQGVQIGGAGNTQSNDFSNRTYWNREQR